MYSCIKVYLCKHVSEVKQYVYNCSAPAVNALLKAFYVCS